MTTEHLKSIVVQCSPCGEIVFRYPEGCESVEQYEQQFRAALARHKAEKHTSESEQRATL